MEVSKVHCFFVTTAGKPLPTSQLVANLKEILSQAKSGDTTSENDRPSTSNTNKERSRVELKEKLLAKLNRGIKRKCPFPADNIVGKKIKHICLSPDGTNRITYEGKVIRESTPGDVQTLMEDDYKLYLERGYQFYTLTYDPPYNQLFIYPLKKEWDDNLLTIV